MPPTQQPPMPAPAPMSSGMSSTAKVILVVVILAVLGGVYYWYAQSKASMTPAGGSATTQTPSGATNTDTSDAALVQDSAAIDGQMSGLNSDNASMNSADQPVTQSY